MHFGPDQFYFYLNDINSDQQYECNNWPQTTEHNNNWIHYWASSSLSATEKCAHDLMRKNHIGIYRILCRVHWSKTHNNKNVETDESC